MTIIPRGRRTRRAVNLMTQWDKQVNPSFLLNAARGLVEEMALAHHQPTREDLVNWRALWMEIGVHLDQLEERS